MEKEKIPANLVFLVNPDIFQKRLEKVPTPELMKLYRKEKDKDVRQAMASELIKRLKDIPTPELMELYRGEESWNICQIMAPELAKRIKGKIEFDNFEM